MEIIKSSDGATDKITEMSIFEGGDVWRRQIANAQTTENEDFSFSIVQFSAGAKTKLHTHSGDQILYCLAGIGEVGANGKTELISVGDTVVIPANEVHWHGSGNSGSPMTHIALTKADSETEVL